jgi:3-deoxy-D-manno-octulosonate 8-phosphate phosphatase (KDO 8-P phosphatase)
MSIKIIFTDIDGVWTDGGMYYDQNGNELKKFHTYDSAGVLISHKYGIPVAIITGEETEIVSNRAKKIHVDYVFQGAKNKLSIAQALCVKLGINLNESAFIGDDINDLELLNSVGFSAAPINAHHLVKKLVNYITTTQGGEGAFREFVEKLEEMGLLKA